jgi:hypothetical protein
LGINPILSNNELFNRIYSELSDKIQYSKGKFTIIDTRNYFSEDGTDDVVVGIIVAAKCSDGAVIELPKLASNTVIRNKISGLLDITMNEDPKIFVQFISNDNY